MNSENSIRTVAILGGGTAGWVAAAILARVFRNRLHIVLVEAEDVPIIGVGEATIPPILDLLHVLGVAPRDFMQATGATCKLGIWFEDWNGPGHRYWHPFGTFGAPVNGRPFQHFWPRIRAADPHADIAEYSATASLAEAMKFAEAPGVRHALHFDAVLVGQYLRHLAQAGGVQRLVARITGCTRNGAGLIEELVTTDGRRVAADLFIDCSGFASALLGRELSVPNIDYQHWLPCDRAIAGPSAPCTPLPPYTFAAAHPAGWRWRIPLQHRTGNGIVYSSHWMTDDTAQDLLLRAVPDLRADALRPLRFKAGRRAVFWQGNCVALGLASGFLEPLESTSIQLVINGMFRLLDHFPDRSFAPPDIAAFNHAVTTEFDAVRDFIILHYWLARRRDGGFWQYCAAMQVPDALRARVELYQQAAHIVPHSEEMFTDLSWFFVLDGLGAQPARSDALAALPAQADLLAVLAQLSARVAAFAQSAPLHDAWLADALADTSLGGMQRRG
jgi:tryptophan halogenase